MHKLSKGSRACSSGKSFNLVSLKCHFLHFGERIYTILMVKKDIATYEASLANVFALKPEPGTPIWPIGVGLKPIVSHCIQHYTVFVYTKPGLEEKIKYGL